MFFHYDAYICVLLTVLVLSFVCLWVVASLSGGNVMGSVIAGTVPMSRPHAPCATVAWVSSSVMTETVPAHISCVTQTTTVLMDLMRTLCCVVWKNLNKSDGHS